MSSGFTTEHPYGGGFFDRISSSVSARETLDYAELQDCRTHLRLCAQRIAELEAINVDLEARLEAQANEYIRLETDAAESQARWKTQYEALENECDMWRQSNSHLDLKNHKLKDQLLRTERELHGILQKKYDFIELARREERDRIRAEHVLASENTGRRVEVASPPTRSPTNAYARNHNPQGLAPADVRRGRAILALSDFFGLSSRPDQAW